MADHKEENRRASAPSSTLRSPIASALAAHNDRAMTVVSSRAASVTNTTSRTRSHSPRTPIELVDNGPLVYIPKLIISIPNASVHPDEFGRSHALYIIHVTRILPDAKNPVTTKISKKFSQFKAFHEEWSRTYPVLAETYDLPPKVWIGNRTPEVMEKRREHLEKYIVALSQIACLADHIGAFLQLEPDVLRKEMKDKRDCQNRAELEKLKNVRRSFDAAKDTSRSKLRGSSPIHLETKNSNLDGPKESPTTPGPELPPIPTQFLSKHSKKGSDVSSLYSGSSRRSSDYGTSKDESQNEQDYKTFEAAFDYEPMHDSRTELRFEKGETITVVPWEDPDHPGWMYGFNSKGVGGYFPSNFLKPTAD